MKKKLLLACIILLSMTTFSQNSIYDVTTKEKTKILKKESGKTIVDNLPEEVKYLDYKSNKTIKNLSNDNKVYTEERFLQNSYRMDSVYLEKNRKIVFESEDELDLEDLKFNNGKYTEYFLNGEINKEYYYKNGKISGTYLYRNIFGDEFKSEVVNGNGKLKYYDSDGEFVGELKDNLLSGILSTIDEKNIVKNNVLQNYTKYNKDELIEKYIYDEKSNMIELYENSKYYNTMYGYGSNYDEVSAKIDKVNNIYTEVKKNKNGVDEKLTFTSKNPLEKVNLYFLNDNFSNGEYTYQLNDKMIEKLNIENNKIVGEYFFYDEDISENVSIDISKDKADYKGYSISNLMYEKWGKTDYDYSCAGVYTTCFYEGTLVDGEPTGEWKVYSSYGGTLYRTLVFKNGILEQIKSDDSTMKIKNGNITFNKKSDYENFEYIFNLTTNTIIETDYTEKTKKIFKSDIPINKHTFSNLSSIDIISGSIEEYENNKLVRKYKVKDRVLNGEYSLYNSGKEVYKTYFKDGTGKYKNIFISYDENVKYIEEGNFLNGLKDKEWKIYPEKKGVNSSIELYNNGTLISYENIIDYGDGNKSISKSVYENGLEVASYYHDSTVDAQIRVSNNFKKGIVISKEGLTEREIIIDQKAPVFMDDYKTIYSTETSQVCNFLNGRKIQKINGVDREEVNCSGKKLDGIYSYKNIDGKILYETRFNNGTGFYKGYYDSRLYEEGPLIKGRREGNWKRFEDTLSESGLPRVIQVKTRYQNDKIIEEIGNKYKIKLKDDDITLIEYKDKRYEIKYYLTQSMITKELSENGKNKIREEFIFNETPEKGILNYLDYTEPEILNGLLIDDLYYILSEKNGKYRRYINNKKQIEQNYTNGILNGNYEIYDSKGKLIYKTNFDNGTGYIKEYNERGNLVKEGKFVEALSDGEWNTYERGKLAKKEYYEFGELKNYTKYFLNGDIREKSKDNTRNKFYKNGVIYSTDTYQDPVTSCGIDDVEEEGFSECVRVLVESKTFSDASQLIKDIEYDKKGDITSHKEYYLTGELKKNVSYKNNYVIKEIDYYKNNKVKQIKNYKIIEEPAVYKYYNYETNEIVTEDLGYTNMRNIMHGEYSFFAPNGKQLYTTKFVKGTGVLKAFNSDKSLLFELKSKDSVMESGSYTVPTTKERIEFSYKNLQNYFDGLYYINSKDEDSDIDPEIEKKMKAFSNSQYTFLKGYSSDGTLNLEIKNKGENIYLVHKGKEIKIKSLSLNLKNDVLGSLFNINQKEKTELNVEEIEKVESNLAFGENSLDVNLNFFEIISDFTSMETPKIKFNVYLPSRTKVLEFSIDSSSVESGEVEYKLKENYLNGKSRNEIYFFINDQRMSLQQKHYNNENKKIYDNEGRDYIIKDFYDDGKVKMEIDIEQPFYYKAYDEDGNRIEQEEISKKDNIIYKVISEWLK